MIDSLNRSAGSGSGGAGNPNLNRERRVRYQHPKGAPDADLIFGSKSVLFDLCYIAPFMKKKKTIQCVSICYILHLYFTPSLIMLLWKFLIFYMNIPHYIQYA